MASWSHSDTMNPTAFFLAADCTLKRVPLSVPEVACRLQTDGVKAMILLARTFAQTLPGTGLLQPPGPSHPSIYHESQLASWSLICFSSVLPGDWIQLA